MSQQFAMVFPGQGSQSSGMLSEFSSSIIRNTFHQASEILSYDLWDIVQHNPDGKLNQTEITQPALLTASISLWRLWCDHTDIRPIVLSGHSLGEYSALVCAESLSFEDAVKLVAKRGQFMQEAVPEGQGAMAAIIGLSYEDLKPICLEASIANINAPGQIVIAGYKNAVEKTMQLAKDKGAKLIKKLDVSVPSHCVLMKSASEKFSLLLDDINFKMPKIPVIHNSDPESISIKKALSEQLYSPVRWVECVEKIAREYKVEKIIECGPGKVLTGLCKRIVNIPTLPFEEAIKTCLV